MKMVNIAEAKAKLSHLVQESLEGEEIILCKSNKPLVRWVPCRYKIVLQDKEKEHAFKEEINYPDEMIPTELL